MTIEQFSRSSELVAAAREWFIECGADEDTVNDLSPIKVAKIVQREYDGGIVEFALNMSPLLTD